jgi:predicted dehydrogenase
MGWSAASYASIRGANDRIGVGIVGFSERAKDALIPAFAALARELNFEFRAVSDIWSRRREEGAAFVGRLNGKPVVGVRNNDELYQRKDIDAVIISTADFQHALHGVEAVRAGRDAYIEKPLANRMGDARAILRAVEETKRVVQIGTQRRSTESAIKVREYLQSGQFGDLNMVELAWHVNQPGRWRRPALVATLRQEDTDWERFQLNRPKAAWDPRKYLEFRLFWPYSSGIPDQWMVHQIDLVQWFTGLNRPRSVTAGGGIYQWRDGRTNPDTVTAVLDYGPFDNPSKGFQVLFSARMGNASGRENELFFSNRGTLDLTTTRVSAEGGLAKADAGVMGMQPNLAAGTTLLQNAFRPTSAANTGVDVSVLAHMRNWMECIRSRREPVAGVRAGYNHSVALCMTIAALHSGRRATFDDAKQDVVTT